MFTYSMYVDGKEASYNATKTGAPYGDLLYQLDFNSAGEVKGLNLVKVTTSALGTAEDQGVKYTVTLPAATGSSITITKPDATTTTVAAVKDISSVSGTKLTIAGTEYTLDSDLAVYMLDDDDWSIEKKSTLGDLKVGDTLYLYNVDSDDDEVVTVAVIIRP